MARPHSAAALVLLAAAAATAATVASDPSLSAGMGVRGAAGGPAGFKEGEVLVKFRRGANRAATLAGVSKSGLSAVQRGTVGGGVGGSGAVHVVALPPGMPVAEGLDSLRSDPAVIAVEPNYIMKPLKTPDGPMWPDSGLWGMRAGYGADAEAAWDIASNCSEVYVAVVDTGIEVAHPDLQPNIWTNPDEVPGDGLDNDGNGFIDDVNGFDFASNTGNVFAGALDDSHGTHVAGTIGSRGSGGSGVPGICWSGIKIISAKFIGGGTGTLLGALQALDYVYQLKTEKGLNIVATSNSWGCGTDCYSDLLLEAIEVGRSLGILFVAAAGNEGTDAPSYPAAYSLHSPAVISVASLDFDGSLSAFSNYGASWVALGAPGGSVLSTWPPGGYAIASGTSMAAPHVTGAAALYKAVYPAATTADIKAALLASAVPTASLSGGYTKSGGRLDVFSLLLHPPGACSPACGSREFCGKPRVSGRAVGWAESACIRCPSQCAACSSDAGTCTACAEGRESASGSATCRGFTCSPACAPGSWCHKTASGAACTACPAECRSCTSQAACQECQPGREGPSCQGYTCHPECGASQYCKKSSSSASCAACPINCAACSPASCTACRPGWAGPTCSACISNEACGAGSYCSGGSCASCPANCAACTSSTSCTSCKPGFKGATCAMQCGVAGSAAARCNACCSGQCAGLSRRCK